MDAVAERVADYLVGHHPGVPRLGQAEQALAAARGSYRLCMPPDCDAALTRQHQEPAFAARLATAARTWRERFKW